MYIDGTRSSIEDVLTKVRDLMRSQPAGEADVEVLVESREHAIKVKAFCSMTGCDVKTARSDDGYRMKVTGGSCNACR